MGALSARRTRERAQRTALRAPALRRAAGSKKAATSKKGEGMHLLRAAAALASLAATGRRPADCWSGGSGRQGDCGHGEPVLERRCAADQGRQRLVPVLQGRSSLQIGTFGLAGTSLARLARSARFFERLLAAQGRLGRRGRATPPSRTATSRRPAERQEWSGSPFRSESRRSRRRRSRRPVRSRDGRARSPDPSARFPRGTRSLRTRHEPSS
jgi:hypothetical protein